MLEQIEKILQKQKLYLEKLYGYQEAGKIQLIRSHGQLLKEEYRDDGILRRSIHSKKRFLEVSRRRESDHTESN